MSYELRRITDEDEEYFLKCGVRSPFGGEPSYGYDIIENYEENVKMAFMGGQGIMTDDLKEWSEMPKYCAVIWNEKSYMVEFYRKKFFTHNDPLYDTFEVVYKIKAVHSFGYNIEKKQEFLKLLQNCFTAYGNEGVETSICEKVSFMDTEVRWA